MKIGLLENNTNIKRESFSAIKKTEGFDACHQLITKSDYLITTDKKLLNKSIDDIKIINPIEFILRVDGEL